MVNITFAQTVGWGVGCCNQANYKVGQGQGNTSG